jgi:flagellar biosynthesis protein FliP
MTRRREWFAFCINPYIPIFITEDKATAMSLQATPPEIASVPMELFCPAFRFDPVTAQFIRVNMVKATQSPVIHGFKLYERRPQPFRWHLLMTGLKELCYA